MKLSIIAGANSQSVVLFIQDSSSTVGAGLAGLVYNTSLLAAYYTFAGANATATAITLASLASPSSAWSSGGFVEIDSTHMKGLYRFDIPNAALATSKGRSVTFYFYGAANMAPCVLEVELTGWDNQDSVRGGMAALPNASAAAVIATVNDVSPSSSSFKGASTLSSSDNFYQGSWLAFTSGSLAGITRRISSYTGATRLLSFSTPFPVSPSNGDAFIVIGGTT